MTDQELTNEFQKGLDHAMVAVATLKIRRMGHTEREQLKEIEGRLEAADEEMAQWAKSQREAA